VKLEDFREKQIARAASDEELREALEREFQVIGRRLRRTDGLAKSSGRATFTDDISLPGMLHAKILRSPHPHARISGIDVSKALESEGVHAIVTGSDMPETYGILPWARDEYALCIDKVRYVGDGVAAVAAVDEESANEALDLIEVEYEVLPHFLDPEEALAHPEMPIHEPKKPDANGNISKHVRLEFGEVDKLLEDSEVIAEAEYYFEGTTHTAIEPHCAIGYFDTSGKLTVWSTTQVPHYLHRELARVLDLDVARVRVIQPPIGGAFGGKSEPFDLEFCVAKLAMITGRPVKILYTREEVFYAHRGRHPMLMRYRTGADKNGRIQAVDASTILDGGGYESLHEQAVLRAETRSRLRTAPLRHRGPAGQAGRGARHRPDRVETA
jgi:CO/xanthine dehydrogenase Mo-binding subunit